jgi:hypothetical protein
VGVKAERARPASATCVATSVPCRRGLPIWRGAGRSGASTASPWRAPPRLRLPAARSPGRPPDRHQKVPQRRGTKPEYGANPIGRKFLISQRVPTTFSAFR